MDHFGHVLSHMRSTTHDHVTCIMNTSKVSHFEFSMRQANILISIKLALSSLLHDATTANKARLLAESVPQAHVWLRTVPIPRPWSST